MSDAVAGDEAAVLGGDLAGPVRVRLEAAVAELLEGAGVELSATEWLLHDLLVDVAERLDSVRAQILCDGPITSGSRGQRRAHPLLSHERELSRDVVRRLREFEAAVRRRSYAGRTLSELLGLPSSRPAVGRLPVRE